MLIKLNDEKRTEIETDEILICKIGHFSKTLFIQRDNDYDLTVFYKNIEKRRVDLVILERNKIDIMFESEIYS